MGNESSRARVSKQQSTLFTQSALTNKQKGALDDNGNPVGSQNDLGQDGQFGGLSIVVSCQYDKAGFDRLVVPALQTKGFTIVHLDESHPKLLQDANQFWLISGHQKTLSDEMIRTIVERWKNGLAIYVIGDNDPYFFDANRLLKAMKLPTMHGNYPGQKIVGPYDKNKPAAGGFIKENLIMRGINTLYEGITVAELNCKELADAHCETILFNSQGKPLIAVCSATAQYA